MKIGYIAWGSLLWDFTKLRLKYPWKDSNIQLPLNFSRISDKGKGRLTLVIDKKNGKLNNVFLARTKSNDLNKAINQIKNREKTRKSNIGYINLKDNTVRTKLLNKEHIQNIKKLAIKNNLDAIIWTDIPPNFQEITGDKFNVTNATKYIESKKNKKKMYIKIIKYIFLCKIFGNIKTPISDNVIKKLMCNNCK